MVVIAVHYNHQRLGYVMEKFELEKSKSIVPHEPAAFFTHHVQLDPLTIPVNHILSLPTHISETGRTYKLLAEINHASHLLRKCQDKSSGNVIISYNSEAFNGEVYLYMLGITTILDFVQHSVF
jgi:hypothetical protein